MNCDCHWCKDRNNIFIKHILQLLSISECDSGCKCLLCEIAKKVNCKCSCTMYSTDIENCGDCEKKICPECETGENKCFACNNKKFTT
jgi:hypothetical protein